MILGFFLQIVCCFISTISSKCLRSPDSSWIETCVSLLAAHPGVWELHEQREARLRSRLQTRLPPQGDQHFCCLTRKHNRGQEFTVASERLHDLELVATQPVSPPAFQLTDVRSADKRRTLLQFIVQQLQERNPELLDFHKSLVLNVEKGGSCSLGSTDASRAIFTGLP